MIVTDNVKLLFKRVRTKLGAPIRRVELSDDQLCDLLDVSIGDYSTEIRKNLIESNWLSMQGKNFSNYLNDPSKLAYELTTRNLDWSKDYSYWFSKEVGLQQRGNYELKKDYFQIENGKQVYVVPAGREINKVMYITPSTTKAAMYGNGGVMDFGGSMGFGQLGGAANPMGVYGMYIGNVYDVALTAADLKYKNSLIRGDLAYQVTAGPDGTHLIHLLSTPGQRSPMASIANDATCTWGQMANCYCWYTYYDVNDSSDALQCAIDNKDDVIISPDQIPFEQMQFDLMNDMAQNIVRKLLVAEAMITVGMIRGYASGVVKLPTAEMNLDYSMLAETGKQDKRDALQELKEWLEKLLPWNIMKNQADMADSLMKVLQQKPMPNTFIVR